MQYVPDQGGNYSELDIPFGKSLTYANFEKTVEKYYLLSLSAEKICFDLKQIEWVSIFELLLLIQWMETISKKAKLVSVIYPANYFLHGIDQSKQEKLFEHPIEKPMLRRKRVLDFLLRLGVFKEINRIAAVKGQFTCKGSSKYTDFVYDDSNDPFDVRLLRVTPFYGKIDLDIERELSNEKLLTLLKEHSCLDPIDSGMLSSVVIEELASNAEKYGIMKSKLKSCAWLSARMVKASRSTISEMPKWFGPAFTTLLGKNYIEIALCDNGPGIFNELKESVPSWIRKKGESVKATLDYAFDKFSSSTSEFRTEMESVPRGLFYVYDLVRQYRGLLSVRSGGYYMVYDFLTRPRHPRLLGLYNDGGGNTDIGGTGIQIILPQSKGLYLSTSSFCESRKILKDPILFEVYPSVPASSQTEDYSRKIAKELEAQCQGCADIPIIVDFFSFDLSNLNHHIIFINMLRVIFFLENPNLLWILSPNARDTLNTINDLLVSGNSAGQEGCFDIGMIFGGMDNFDINVIPVIFPNTEVMWLGATSEQSEILTKIWGVGEIEIADLGSNTDTVYALAATNPHLLSIKDSNFSEEKTISFRLVNYDIDNSLPNILRQTVEILCRTTNKVINCEGCYHLPHGEYSNTYIYLKPILRSDNLARKIARCLVTLLALEEKTRRLEIDIVIGGTHSAKRLIKLLGQEFNCQTLTIDRYVGQIDESLVGEKVAKRNALIVSDIISSGSFVSEIIRRISEDEAHILAVASVCDLRKKDFVDSLAGGIKSISLLEIPIDRYPEATTEPVFEINPISLRPVIPEKENIRNHVHSIINDSDFEEWIHKSGSLVTGHLVLGPTHYTYFVDTKNLMERYCEDIYQIVMKDAYNLLRERDLSLSNLTSLVTAEDSNAELFFPDLVKKEYPDIEWVQIERIRLSIEGTWQLDRLDESMDSISHIRDGVVLLWDDGSNTGNTLIQMLEIVAEYEPRFVLAYCLVNRLSSNRARFYTRINNITKGDRTVVRFLANIPISTYVYSNCPLCSNVEPAIPPIAELEKLRDDRIKLKEIKRWNHISADTLREQSRRSIEARGFIDVDNFLLYVTKIRSILGYFESAVNVDQSKRHELLSFLEDKRHLSALCFILNREPQFANYLIDFQIRSFEDKVVSSIVNQIGSGEFYGASDLLEYFVSRNPDAAVSNFESCLPMLYNNNQNMLLFLYCIFKDNELTNISERLKVLSDKINLVPREKNMGFLKGLISSSLSWINFEKTKKSSNNLRESIEDLQSFYREGNPHGEANEMGKPLNSIITYISFYERTNEIMNREHFESLYRDWRDYTVSSIEERLLYSYTNIKKILDLELANTLKNYYNFESKIGVRRDYLTLQNLLLQLKESNDQKAFLERAKNDIDRRARRLYERLFSETKSPVAKIVKIIPVYVVKHLLQKIESNMPWISLANITLIKKIDVTEVFGLMSTRTFRQILDRTFINMKVHNFCLVSDVAKNAKRLINPNIIIKLTVQDMDLILKIKSNGPNDYKDGPGQGIRMNETACNAFGALYIMKNEGKWVTTQIKMKRW